MNVKEIQISQIKIVENSRLKIEKLEGLMQDIKQTGLKQPIGVAETKSGDYVLIFGHRRLSACTKLGWKKIPANVYPDMEIAELLINNVAENIHREETSPIELGRICSRFKEMDLTPSEIAAKLSIPIGRVTSALNSYRGIPTKHRNRIAYVNGSNARKGNIPASVACKIMATKRSFGLSDAAVEKLLTIARKEEYGMSELSMIGKFLDQKLSVTQAIEKSKEYKLFRVDVVINNEEVERLLTKYKIDSQQILLQSIIYGELPPLRKPDFVKLKQTPVKE